MRIAVVGAGGVGGYVGAMLVRGGHDVVLLARGAHAAAIREHGLCVLENDDRFVVHPPCPPQGAAIEPADLVIVAVKGYDLDDVLTTVRSLLKDEGAVLTLSNGVGPAEVLAAWLPVERLVVGQITVGAWLASPGVIQQRGSRRNISLGSWPTGDSAAVRSCSKLLGGIGFDTDVVADTRAMVWNKLIWAASYGAISAIARATAGEVRASEGLLAMLRAMLTEGVHVGQRQGIAIDDAASEAWIGVLARLDPRGKTSMLRDAERHRRLELDVLSGAIVRAGAQFGVPTPMHALACALLEPTHARATTEAKNLGT